MAITKSIIVGAGGVAAGTPFTVGRLALIVQALPPVIADSNVVQESGFIGIPATVAGDATNLNRAIGIGLDLQNYTALLAGTTRRPVFIGFQSGYSDATGVPADAVAIGNGCRAEAAAVAIGAGVVVRCNAGSDRPVVINSTGVTNVNVIGVCAIACGGSSILSQNGTFIAASNSVNTGGGIGIGGTTGPDVQAYGIAIGLESTVTLTGNRGIVIGGSGARAGAPTVATDYARCIAIGIDAIAAGSGAGGSVHAIAIGDAASATGSTTAAAIALGRSAVATAGQCVIGSLTRPYDFRVFTDAVNGIGFQADASAVADNTRILVWDVTGAALKRVSRGAVDSGGVGFRLLRIPN